MKIEWKGIKPNKPNKAQPLTKEQVISIFTTSQPLKCDFYLIMERNYGKKNYFL